MHYSSELLFDEGQVPRLILSECIINIKINDKAKSAICDHSRIIVLALLASSYEHTSS